MFTSTIAALRAEPQGEVKRISTVTTAPATKAPNQKKLRSTPLARQRLEVQLLNLAADPTTWPSNYLRRAFEIVAKYKPPEIARQIVLDAVRAADRAVKAASGRDLALARGSALADLTQCCKRVAKCTKPTRLRKQIRTDVDEAARSILVANPVDSESIQIFLCRLREIVEGRPEDPVASAIYRDLVASRAYLTHREDLRLDGRGPTITVDGIPPDVVLAGRRPPKIAADYEAIRPEIRLACEAALREVVDEKQERLTAHDIFASLHAKLDAVSAAPGSRNAPRIINSYLTGVERIWTKHGLPVGRGYSSLDDDYISPFHEFAERVLLNQRDPGSRIFSPFTEGEIDSARAQYDKMPHTARDDISDKPFGGSWAITQHVLRGYLERS
jgi:hypothetical protein